MSLEDKIEWTPITRREFNKLFLEFRIIFEEAGDEEGVQRFNNYYKRMLLYDKLDIGLHYYYNKDLKIFKYETFTKQDIGYIR